jgi:hypothetical protein
VTTHKRYVVPTHTPRGHRRKFSIEVGGSGEYNTADIDAVKLVRLNDKLE